MLSQRGLSTSQRASTKGKPTGRKARARGTRSADCLIPSLVPSLSRISQIRFNGTNAWHLYLSRYLHHLSRYYRHPVKRVTQISQPVCLDCRYQIDRFTPQTQAMVCDMSPISASTMRYVTTAKQTIADNGVHCSIGSGLSLCNPHAMPCHQ